MLVVIHSLGLSQNGPVEPEFHDGQPFNEVHDEPPLVFYHNLALVRLYLIFGETGYVWPFQVW